ncbi:hypothetical protein DdX_13698 [Ditylenchus destructor]|uniref:Uncharacterized protein n=1 Tax=Ditylenchus destructor TaxID=166010 RepID=A0AAD4MTM0_9BILA|nr:hypothetical protein DdX_13698 [Ditylenchus destructor]
MGQFGKEGEEKAGNVTVAGMRKTQEIEVKNKRAATDFMILVLVETSARYPATNGHALISSHRNFRSEARGVNRFL